MSMKWLIGMIIVYLGLSAVFVVPAVCELLCTCRNPFPLFDNPSEPDFRDVVTGGKTRSILRDAGENRVI